MLNKISYSDIFEAEHGFLNSRHHFSFADYFDRHNMGFGDVRVVNDDIVKPHSGFPLHPHQNMEILTYIIDGKLTHKDSTGSDHTIAKGEMQYMSAGTGIYHSEYNETDNDARLLQIWLLPNIKNQMPSYGFIKLREKDRLNHLYGVINTNADNQLLKTNVKVYLTQVVDGKIEVPMLLNEVGYLINIEGESQINGITLKHGDALKFDENLTIQGHNAHVIVLITKPH